MIVTPGSSPARVAASSDAVDLAEAIPLSPDEADYVTAARAHNTRRGYTSDWREFTGWCAERHAEPLPALPATVSGYLVYLARAGAKVGTMSRRLSAIRFAHQLRNLPDPSDDARVVAVWEGISATPTGHHRSRPPR